ncbi:unnamed protein product, partial [Staurois parvus]
RECAVRRSVVRCILWTQRIPDQRKEPKTSAQSCDQLCPITADRICHAVRDSNHSSEGTCTLIIRALTISPQQCHLSVSINASCQCSSVPPACAHHCHINTTYQCLPVHINATCQYPSELPFSVTYRCQSVPPINASQCHLSVLPIS